MWGTPTVKRENEITETGLWKTSVETSHLTSESGFNDETKRYWRRALLNQNLLLSIGYGATYLARSNVCIVHPPFNNWL